MLAVLVVTITRVTAKYIVCAARKRLEDKHRVRRAAAYQAHVGRVLDAGGPRQVCADIDASVTQKSDDLGLKIGVRRWFFRLGYGCPAPHTLPAVFP